MKEVNTDMLLEEVSKLLDRLNCDYLLALFPSDETGHKTVSLGMKMEDIDDTALLLSKIILEGGELGWNLLKLMQKTCKSFPVPLHQLLAASHADYQDIVKTLGKGLSVRSSGKSSGKAVGRGK